MTPATIILIGASVRAAAQSAVRAGIRVIGVDFFGDIDCRDCCERFILVRPDETDAQLNLRLPSLPRLSVGGRNHAAASPDLAQPALLESVARDSGTCFAGAYQSPRNDLDPNVRWLWKNRIGSGGLGVSFSREGQVEGYWQPWIAGRRFGVSFLSDRRDTVMLGVCRSLHTRKGSQPFVYSGSFGPLRLTRPFHCQLQSLGDTIVRQTGVVGLFGIDLVMDSAGRIWLLEINPRWTASSELIEADLIRRGMLKQNESLIGSVAKLLFGCEFERVTSPTPAELRSRLSRKTDRSQALLKRVVFAKHAGLFHRDVADRWLTPAITLSDIPMPGTQVAAGMPIATLRMPWESSAATRGAIRIVTQSLE
ncbi:ATP-grasp domain-containing protein [Novipirellula artificiosorum]|uniref:ATP-grasp domain protein n=1 Tax=Novipirellula artificiosorum TaxID=2528016 RepID=A0A5C6DQY9_9BACT|nr:ATP-grasp domain-containing protein [Novipirellula artificiosorum]TWU39260.1 ATP-grasp domain protein [Novipirellula artificiosorum]